jgi:ribosomal protein S27AE
MIKYKACPRCRGDLYLAEDIFGNYFTCFQCGYLQDVEETKLKPRTEPRLPGSKGSLTQPNSLLPSPCPGDPSPLSPPYVIKSVSTVAPKTATTAPNVAQGFSQCRHHWLIEPSAGPISQGVCQFCREVRQFQNSSETIGWADWELSIRSRTARPAELARTIADTLDDGDEG